MRRRKVLVTLVGLAVVAVGAFVLWPRKHRITRENYERIREGMSRAELEAILGPSGDYTTGPVLLNAGTRSVIDIGDDGNPHDFPATEWRGDTASVWVAFSASGDVVFA